jgi:hypothetical protein
MSSRKYIFDTTLTEIVSHVDLYFSGLPKTPFLLQKEYTD